MYVSMLFLIVWMANIPISTLLFQNLEHYVRGHHCIACIGRSVLQFLSIKRSPPFCLGDLFAIPNLLKES
jgi:hypothetical protein